MVTSSGLCHDRPATTGNGKDDDVREWTGKRYWLVGASAGLGRALAHGLSALGVELILSARKEDDLRELAAELPGRTQVVPLDVADRAAVDAAARQIGQIDGVAFLAGVYWPLGVDDWDGGKIDAMLDVNLIGAHRVVGAVLPQFLQRGAGHIFLAGSLSGYRGLPGAFGYGASKAGVMYLAEQLRAELRGTGIEVQLSNPGFVKTRLTEKNDFAMPMILEPEDAARRMVEHMSSGAFAHNFPWLMGVLFRATQFLPGFAYFGLFSRRR